MNEESNKGKEALEFVKTFLYLISFILLLTFTYADAAYGINETFWSSAFIFTMPFWIDALTMFTERQWRAGAFVIWFKLITGGIAFVICIVGMSISLYSWMQDIMVLIIWGISGLFVLIEIVSMVKILINEVKKQHSIKIDYKTK